MTSQGLSPCCKVVQVIRYSLSSNRIKAKSVLDGMRCKNRISGYWQIMWVVEDPIRIIILNSILTNFTWGATLPK